MTKYIPVNGPVTPGQIGREIIVGEYKATPDTLSDGDHGEAQLDDQGNLKTMAAGGLRIDSDSIAAYPGGTTYTHLTASGQAASGSGMLSGIFVASASATPTITVYDNMAGSGTIVINTFTPVAGTMYKFPSPRFSTGCYVVIGGTVDCTVFTGPTTV